MALELSRRVILDRLDQADALVEIRTCDESKGDQLLTISTTARRYWRITTDKIYTEPHIDNL